MRIALTYCWRTIVDISVLKSVVGHKTSQGRSKTSPPTPLQKRGELKPAHWNGLAESVFSWWTEPVVGHKTNNGVGRWHCGVTVSKQLPWYLLVDWKPRRRAHL